MEREPAGGIGKRTLWQRALWQTARDGLVMCSWRAMDRLWALESCRVL